MVDRPFDDGTWSDDPRRLEEESASRSDKRVTGPPSWQREAPLEEEQSSSEPPTPDEQDWEGFGGDSDAGLFRRRGSADEPSSPVEERTGSLRRVALEWFLVVAGAVALAVVVRTFLLGAYYIPSPSMEPTLSASDRILVNKLSYRLHDVNRGDLVVFNHPASSASGNDDLIKRVIGLPGDTVTASEGRVFVNEGLLIEPYLAWAEGTNDFMAIPWCDDGGAGSCRVPQGHVFVMGDNRPNSRDSRSFGPVPIESIVGRAFVRFWPLNQLDRL